MKGVGLKIYNVIFAFQFLVPFKLRKKTLKNAHMVCPLSIKLITDDFRDFRALKMMLHGTIIFATTSFSETQRCNVGTML